MNKNRASVLVVTYKISKPAFETMTAGMTNEELRQAVGDIEQRLKVPVQSEYQRRSYETVIWAIRGVLSKRTEDNPPAPGD